MNIQSQKVEGTIKDFLKKGALNLWQHQVVYLLPLLMFYPLMGIIGILPSYTKNFFIFFTGIFFMFLYMEITFTSTQEKYNPKKYLTSIVLSIFIAINFIKRHWIIVLMMISVSLAIDFGSTFFKAPVVQEDYTLVNMIKEFLLGIVRHSGTNALMDIFLIGYMSKEVASDYFVTQRMTGMTMETPESITSEAMEQNIGILRIASQIAFFFTLFSAILLGLQGIIFIILCAALTFYSMEVFGVDTGKKQRQEEAEKEKKSMLKLVPIPYK